MTERKDNFKNLADIICKTGTFLNENGAYLTDEEIHIKRVKHDIGCERLQATVTIAICN